MQQPNQHVYAPRQNMTPNAIPHHPLSNPPLSQHEPPFHTITQTQRDMLQEPIITTPNAIHRQRHYRLSSSSEEADDIPQASNNNWQVIRRTKRKKKSTAHNSLFQIPKQKHTTATTYSHSQQTKTSQGNNLSHHKTTNLRPTIFTALLTMGKW